MVEADNSTLNFSVAKTLNIRFIFLTRIFYLAFKYNFYSVLLFINNTFCCLYSFFLFNRCGVLLTIGPPGTKCNTLVH